MDVSQDLLIATELRTEALDVIVGMRIHVLSLQTGQPHPLAQEPVFTVDYRENDGRIGVNAECRGDTLGFIATTEVFDTLFELWVWNWKTGELRLNTYSASENQLDLKFSGANSFHLLDDDHVLVPAIEEYDGQNSDAALYVLDYHDVTPERQNLSELFTRGTAFPLPTLTNDFEYVQFYCVANIPPPLMPSSPFLPDPALRMIMFQIGINDLKAPPTPQGMSYFYLFIRSETLLRHYQPGVACGGYDVDAEWTRDALIIRKPGDSDIWLVDEVSHNRCLVMESRADQLEVDDPPMAIMIYEFPPAEALRHDLAAGKGLGKWEYVVEPQTLIDERMWEQVQVKSGLPFRKVDTGLLAYPVEVSGEMKEHALTGDLYLQYDNACWRVIQLPGVPG